MWKSCVWVWKRCVCVWQSCRWKSCFWKSCLWESRRASSHIGSKSASQATRLRAGRDIRQSQGRELTGQCLHVCPARRISPSPCCHTRLWTKRRPQAHKSASSRTTGQRGDRRQWQYVPLLGTGARSKTWNGTEMMCAKPKHGGHRCSRVKPRDASASSHVGSKAPPLPCKYFFPRWVKASTDKTKTRHLAAKQLWMHWYALTGKDMHASEIRWVQHVMRIEKHCHLSYKIHSFKAVSRESKTTALHKRLVE